MRQHKRYRALKDEFLSWMERFGAEPVVKDLKVYFRRHKVRFSTNAPSDLLAGNYVEEKLAVAFIEIVILEAENPNFVRTYNALARFVGERGIKPIDLDHIDQILSHICTPMVDEPPVSDQERHNLVDWLGAAAIGLAKPGFQYMLENSIAGCRQKSDSPEIDDLKSAAEWTFIRVAQCVSAEGESLPPEKAFDVAKSHMGIGVVDYCAAVASWHACNPWTVVMARRKQLIVGATIVLPLTEAAYDLVMSGKMATYECTEEDLVVPSRHLVIESVAERPETLSPMGDPETGQRKWINATKPMRWCLILQVTALIRHQRWPRGTQYHMLSFAGTPKNRQRLLDTGFQATGRFMARSGVEFWERVIETEGQSELGLLDAVFMAMGSRLCPPVPPLP